MASNLDRQWPQDWRNDGREPGANRPHTRIFSWPLAQDTATSANGTPAAHSPSWVDTAVEEVNRVLREAAAAPPFAGILDYADDPIVSSDVLHGDASGTFDSLGTMVLAGDVSKTLTWFENGRGYARRLADLIRRFQEIDSHVQATADGRTEARR